MFCKHCGQELSDNSAFCESCGRLYPYEHVKCMICGVKREDSIK